MKTDDLKEQLRAQLQAILDTASRDLGTYVDLANQMVETGVVGLSLVQSHQKSAEFLYRLADQLAVAEAGAPFKP